MNVLPCSKLGIIALSTVDPICFRSKLFINQAIFAFAAQKARLMPVFLFVRQILIINHIINVLKLTKQLSIGHGEGVHGKICI